MGVVTRAFAAIVLVLVLAGTVSAEEDHCEMHSAGAPRLCSYEPTTIGYTKDSDDVGFMDFKLSVKYQLFPNWITRAQNFVINGVGDNSALYFAFTGRFGQYLGTRDSSPVVGKQFNPKLFYRYWYDEPHKNYVDVSYAHESNGQSIDSLAEYQTALANTNDPNAIKDQLSRGWDYADIMWKWTFYQSEDRAIRVKDPCENEECKQDFCAKEACKKTLCESDFCPNNRHKEDRRSTVVSYVNLKRFLRYGLLQHGAENYNTWENDPEGKPRDRVNGVSVMLKWVERGDLFSFTRMFHDLKAVVKLETGYREAFRYNTYRFEFGSKFMQLPVSLWYQKGYNSDLAQYYKKVESWGFEAEIGSF